MSSSESPEAMLADILSVLESKTTGSKGRCEAYTKFTRSYCESGFNLFGLDVTQNIGRVLVLVSNDVTAGAADVGQSALEVLGVCLNDRDIVRSMTDEECQGVLDLLCGCVHKTEEKVVCTRALWCLGVQGLPDTIVQNKVDVVLEAVEFAVQKWDGHTITVEHESVNTIARLTEQAPREMTPHCVRWGKVLLPRIAHSAIKVRERALKVTESALPLLAMQRKELVSTVFPVLKSKVLPELKTLFQSKHELFVLRCWTILVQFLSEELHHGSYINHILPIVELGFKSASEETKMAAFSAWQQLIDNFSTNPAVLGDLKRIKLVMQVFKINNAKQEKIALHKVKVWWHFLWLLGNKVSSNFDMVAAPLLRACLGGMRPGEQGSGETPRALHNGTSPVTPRMNLAGAGSQFPTFMALQMLGCEALAHFLGPLPEDCLQMEHNFELDALQHNVVTGPSFFVKHSTLFINMATELFISLGKDVPESVMFHVWHWLLTHLRSAIDSPSKLDVREVLSLFLARFQVMILSHVFSSSAIMTLFDGICKLPKKVLGSTMYSIGGGENMHGTPALFLAELLLTPVLLQCGPTVERYHTLFSSILSHGLHNTSGTLGFLCSVLQLLERNAEFVEKPEVLWRLWSAVVNPLLEHITMTNEVNQGDALEHNFDCCVAALTLPVTCGLSRLPAASLKTLVKTWTELFKTVNRLAAMVTNADANVVCEEVFSKILALNKSLDSQDAVVVDFQVQLCSVAVATLDFSAMKNQSSFGLASSPTKWTRRRHRPLENIHSLVLVLTGLLHKAVEVATNTEQKKPGIPLQGMFNTQVDMLCTLFTHVSASSVISDMIGHLAQPIGILYKEASNKSSAKIYNNAFQQKLEKLWQDICTSLQSRYTGLYDSEFLQKLSPMLEATFLHSRRQIKNLTVGLWGSTFGTTSNLEYPEILRPVLSKAKEKSSIQLPGWVPSSTPVIEETPVSQMSQSQAPEPRLPGMPSPHKIHGSILHRPISPARKTSPMRPPASPKSGASAKKKNLGFGDFADADFVVIKSSPKKKMVLTDHQKEVMKERRILPAMYNNLETSVDGSLMINHFNMDTNQDSSLSSTPTPTSSQPFAIFGSVVPPTAEQSNSHDQKEDQKDRESQEPKVKDKRVKAASNLTEEVRRSSRRRSVRFKVTSSSEDGKKDTETVLMESSNSSSVIEKCDTDVTVNDAADSVVVIGDSEPMEVDSEPDQPGTAGTVESVDLTKDSQVDNECNKVPTSESNNTETAFISPPQNFLGVLDSLTVSSGRSDQSKSSSGETLEQSDDKAPENVSDQSEKCTPASDRLALRGEDKDELSVDGVMKEVASVLESPKADKQAFDISGSVEDDPASEPLFSWTQKLNEYSQSPKAEATFCKSLSQDDARSPRHKSVSPHKSPRRRKKITKENDMMCTLDKWITKSPKKDGLLLSDNIPQDGVTVGNVSMTLVEDTQSPSKFAQKNKTIDGNSSVLETPPKNVLDAVTIRHGNSNRKLFSSQNSNIDTVIDMVEDSNIVPGSPAKLFTSLKDLGPFLKIKKLTVDEIKRYSPKKCSENVENITPSKRMEKHSSKGRNKCFGGDDEKAKEPPPHVHDDFSEFKPIDPDQVEQDFYSKNLTNTEQAMLELSEMEQDYRSTSKVNDCSTDEVDGSIPVVDVNPSEMSKNSDSSVDGERCQSPGLFSQDVSESIGNIISGETLRNSEDLSQPSGISQSLVSQNSSLESQSESYDTSESVESEFDVNQNSTLKCESILPKKARKRKQITPKKLPPSDLRPGSKRRKSKCREENKVERKVSPRLKERQAKETRVENKKETLFKKAGNEIKLESRSEKDLQVEEGSMNTNEEQLMSLLLDSQSNLDGTQCVVVEKTKETERKQEKRSLRLRKDAGKDDEKNRQSENIPETVVDQVESKKTDANKLNMLTVSDEKSEKGMEEKQMQEAEQMGQKTPEGRSNVKEPERRSTTKHKKEVAHKMALKRSKDVTVNDSNSNLDSNESDDDIPLLETKLKSAENLEKKLSEQAKELVNCISHEEMSVVDNEHASGDGKQMKSNTLAGKCDSFESDDDVPLIHLSAEKKKRIKKNFKEKKTEKKVKGGVQFNLRSNVIRYHKLRSGEKKARISPQAKKSVDLALKRTRNKQVKKKLINEQPQMVEEPIQTETDTVGVKECGKVESVCDEVMLGNESNEDLCMENNNFGPLERTELDSSGISKNTETEELENSNASNMKELERNSHTESIQETPKKYKHETVAAESESISKSESTGEVKQSDQRDKIDTRRSILKTPTLVPSNMNVSPSRSDFHPIMMGRIYSPTASPSASILKKRRLSEGCLPETDSPPAKQRRVSFAFPLVEKSSGVGTKFDAAVPRSPLVKHSRVVTSMDKMIAMQSNDALATGSSSYLDSQSTVGTPSQTTYQSTQESQLNTTDPVYPELLDCDVLVEKILPQLTTSMWSRGLEQLTRAQKIKTVGDLSKLTEAQIDKLPIKSPKLQTVRRVLGRYTGGSKPRGVALWGPKSREDSKQEGKIADMSKAAVKYSGPQNCLEQTAASSLDVNTLLANSSGLQDEINRLTHYQSETKNSSYDRSTDLADCKGIAAGSCSPSILDLLETVLQRCEAGESRGMKTEHLFKVDQLLSEIHNKIVDSIKQRCHSPTSS